MQDPSKTIQELRAENAVLQQRILELNEAEAQRKHAEDQLRESEYFFKESQRAACIGSYKTDFIAGVWESSEVLDQIFGIDHNHDRSIAGWLEIVHPDDREMMSRYLKEEVIAKHQPFNKEYRVIRKSDGEIRWVNGFGNVSFDSQGNVSSLIGTIQDITDRKRAKEVLQESEERFRTLSDNAPLGMSLIDTDGRYEYVNPAFVQIFGYALSDIPTGREWFRKAYPDPEYRRQTILDWKEALHNYPKLAIRPHIYEVRCKDLTFRTILFRPVSLSSGKQLIIYEDITDRKRIAEENRHLQERLQRSEKMESLGTLAGGVAHDLNNVLGIIVGYAEMTLSSVDAASPLRRSLEHVMNGGLKAAAIVDDLLTLARRGVQGRSILNLNQVVADCRKSPEFANLLSHHPAVRIKTDLEVELLNISGSAVHLGKTLYNLISNAGEAMPQGGTLTIRTTNQYLDKPIQGYDEIREGDYVVLAVSDTGDGIAAQDLKRIFEPFYTKKTMGRSGTGLGLAVVWGTVKDHQGYINVESEEGKGSVFTLYFPVTREELPTEAVTVATSVYRGRGESILIVDDVKEQRDLAASILKTLHYQVASVASGEEAVAYIKDHEIDLIVLDMIMEPGRDGLDTYQAVLAIRPQQKAIIVSGFSESERVKTARDLGAGAYVRKPYIKEKLGIAVRKELDRH